MRTRLPLLTAMSVMLAVAPPVLAQTSAATKHSPPPDAQAPAAAPAPAESTDVSIKDTEGSPAAPTKSKDTLSVDFPDEEIRNILRNVAELFDLNLVIPDTLQGKTSVKLHDVTWRQIFSVVLTPVGYTFIEDGNIIKVVSNESLTQEPVSTEIFVINYAKADDIKATVASLVDAAAGGKLVVDPRTNSLVITERPSRMKRIRPVIDQLDRATDQVMIESKFVEISNNDIKNLGVNWSSLSGFGVTATPGNSGIYTYGNSYGSSLSNGSGVSSGTTGSTTTNPGSTSLSNTSTITTGTGPSTTSSIGTTAGTTVSNAVNNATQAVANVTAMGTSTNAISAVFSSSQFALVLSALQQLSNAKIVSNPTIVTLNNTEASINVAQEYPIPNYQFNQQTGTFQVDGFQYKDIGIILKVTPQVNARGFIKLTLAPEVSQNQGTTTFGGASGASIPIIGTRKATTQVSLKDGYTMGIGGLISTNFNKGTNQIPMARLDPGHRLPLQVGHGEQHGRQPGDFHHGEDDQPRGGPRRAGLQFERASRLPAATLGHARLPGRFGSVYKRVPPAEYQEGEPVKPRCLET